MLDKGLEPWVKDVFLKPRWDDVNQLEAHGVTLRPDFVVKAFGGFAIEPFQLANDADREMERVYEAIADYLKNGDGSPQRL